MQLKEVQKILQEKNIDGWLLYDFHRINPLACDFLGIPPETMLTRRFCYFIPKTGEPIALIHAVETHIFKHLPGKKLVYSARTVFESDLKEILKNYKTVAMEYSPRGAIPTMSRVDGGMLDLVREQGVKVVSSAPFLQYFICRFTDEQYKLHKEAADVLDKTAAKTWEWIGNNLGKITEYDVQQFIFSEIKKGGCTSDSLPICGVNQNSANPHYNPEPSSALLVKKGDFILIDLWCKRTLPHAVYADITRVAVAGQPSPRHLEIFQIVRNAQKTATDFVQQKIEHREEVKGYEVDQVCRKVILDAGYGDFFTHRTGHNIHEEDHGPGANIDSYETLDERPLIPRTCFSIEPGIYLPTEFGVRLEYDVFILENHTIEVTGGIEDTLVEIK